MFTVVLSGTLLVRDVPQLRHAKDAESQYVLPPQYPADVKDPAYVTPTYCRMNTNTTIQLFISFRLLKITIQYFHSHQ